MIETVVAYQLAVGEKLRIQKKRLMPGAGNPNIGRISIVSGIHGDELEGQYICYELQRRIMEQAEWQIMPKVIDLIAHDKVHVKDGRVFVEE